MCDTLIIVFDLQIIWCIAAASLAFNTFYPIPRTTTVITGTFCGIYVVFSLIYELLEGYAIGATQYYSRIENIFQILRNIVFLVAMGHMIFLEEGDVNYNTSIVRIFGGVRKLEINFHCITFFDLLNNRWTLKIIHSFYQFPGHNPNFLLPKYAPFPECRSWHGSSD